MNEQVARNVVLMRAIEMADVKREILSDDDRMYASRSAKELAQWQAADNKSSVTLDHFLEQRSEQILKRLRERIPAFGSFLHRRPLLPTLLAVLPVLALLAGAVLDRIADPHRVDLLSAPLLCIIGWNLLVYLILLAWRLVPAKNTGWDGAGVLQWLSVGKRRLPRKLPAALAVALMQFMTEWTRMSGALTKTRLSRTMHLAAGAFVGGDTVAVCARSADPIRSWMGKYLSRCKPGARDPVRSVRAGPVGFPA